jgi:mannitol/fructose-specific phosphotransferase system IIA component (Ntr-type)
MEQRGRTMAGFVEMLSETSILFLTGEKESIIRELCNAISRGWPSVPAEQLESLVFKRESTLTTRLSPVLALPHAVIPGETENRIAVAVVPDGVDWDNDKEHPVRLVVLLAGGHEEHLAVLSELARVLKDEELLLKLAATVSPGQFITVFRQHEARLAAPFVYGSRDLSAAIFEEALRLRNSIGKARIILHADAIEDGEYVRRLVKGHDVLVVTGGGSRFSDAFIEEHKLAVMPFKGLRRSTHVRFTLLYLLGRGVLSREDLVVNVYGKPGSGFLDSIRLSHLDRELDLPFQTGSDGFPADLELSTFARVLQLSTQLATEGREGKPVGTLFVIGDSAGVSPYTRQMIINPFYGYSDVEKNILDPGIEETVKEYSRIDGAFIIRGDGTIDSAGTFLSGQPTADEMQSGLGARHAAAQGITAVSKAIAVAISESTRKITVFQSGRKVMEL